MQISAATLTEQQAYKLLVGALVPRPIAWVTSISADGRVNAAPFSCFTFVSYSPPLIAISIGRKNGVLKDTARNLLAVKDFVVNIADDSMVDALHLSSQEFPETVSEPDQLGLELAISTDISCPRLAATPISMECRLHEVLEFGSLRTQLFVGEVVQFHIRDDLYRDGKVDTAELRPLGRAAGPNYVRLRDFIRVAPVPETFG